MQTRIRKKRCDQVYGRFGVKSSSGFKITFFGLLLVFSSCSTTKHKNYTDSDYRLDSLNRAISRICLSGEGKGKVLFLNQSMNFSYESFNNEAEETFSLGIYIPILGEELLNIDYKNDKFSGSLYERAIKQFNSSKTSKRKIVLLQKFLKKEAQFLRLIQAIKMKAISCSGVSNSKKMNGTCFFEKENITWERTAEHFEFNQKMDKNYFRVSFEGDNVQYFNKMEMSLKSQNKREIFSSAQQISSCHGIK